jgi:acyl-CoA synthetase (AMP-forming)/AMP-acid ligase II
MVASAVSRVDRIAESRLPEFRDRVALKSEDGETVTYGALAERVARAGGALRVAGLRPGDRFLLVGENCVSMIVLLLAAIRCGAWAVPVNARLSPGEIDAIRAHCRPRRCWFGAESSADAEAHARHACARPEAVDGAGDVWLSPLDTAVDPEAPEADPAGEVAVILYTSGSTGAPKGVMLTHRNLAFIAQGSARLGALRPDDSVYLALPISHSYGLTSVLLCGLQSGATIHPVARFAAERLAEAIAGGLTVFQGVPAMYARLLDWHHRTGRALTPNRLRLAYIGGSMIDPAKKDAAESLLGLRLHHGYGLTEAAPSVTRTLSGEAPSTLSVGWPLPGIEVSLRSPGGAPVPEGDDGELWVRGPNVMKGYYRDPEQTARAVDAQGWLHTGDLARRGAAGELYIAGRIKELIIRGGFNVYPAEVEAAIGRDPGVAQCAVVGRSADGDEEIVAFVEPVPGRRIDGEALRQSLRARLAPYKIPSRVVCMDKLPASGTGKLLRASLKHLAQRL